MPNHKKNPGKSWSRPLSMATARSTFQPPPPPEKIPGPKLLLVGGTYTFIPDWISKNLTFKHFQYSGKSFYETLGDFEPDAIILFVKSTDGHTKHQTFDYGHNHNIPVLVMYKGWSHLIEDAKYKGVMWLVAHYPYKTYITDEDREKRRSKKPKKKTAKKLAYDEKRRKVFAEAGIKDSDARFAKTRYIQSGASHCVLCGMGIKYQFGIDFTIPGEENIISFFPVGSTCIRSWLSSLPDAKYLSKFKKQTKIELDRAKNRPRVEPTQLDFGWD